MTIGKWALQFIRDRTTNGNQKMGQNITWVIYTMSMSISLTAIVHSVHPDIPRFPSCIKTIL
jgi:hypothetical protein